MPCRRPIGSKAHGTAYVVLRFCIHRALTYGLIHDFDQNETARASRIAIIVAVSVNLESLCVIKIYGRP